jgi:hypothetical protein
MAATVTLTKIQHDKRPAHHMNDTENVCSSGSLCGSPG